MIVDCPYCHTSNSETDTGPDGSVLCRSCQRRFQAGEQARDTGSNTTEVARRTLEEREEQSAHAHPATAPELTVLHTRQDDTDREHGEQATRVGTSPVMAMNDVPDHSLEGPTRVGVAPANPHEELTSIGSAPTSPPIDKTMEVDIQHNETVVRPREESTGRTNVMSQQDLYRNLIESHSIEHGDTVSGVQVPPVLAGTEIKDLHREPAQTPNARPWAQEVRRRAFAAHQLFMAQPKPVRVAGSVAAGLLLLLIILSIRLATRSSTTVLFVSEAQPLLSAPVDGARPNGASGGLRRGEQVVLLDRKGDFVVVSDLQGHVGYVQEAGLLQERPASAPDVPFVDCRPAVAEEDVQGCKSRAEAQWESCLSVCEKHDQLSKCNDDCRGQYRVCMAACNGEPVHPEPGYPGSAMPADAPQPMSGQATQGGTPRLEAGSAPGTVHVEPRRAPVKSSKKTDKKHKR